MHITGGIWGRASQILLQLTLVAMEMKFNDIMGYNLSYITGFRDRAIRCCQLKSTTADHDRHGNEICLIGQKLFRTQFAQ